MKTSEVTFGHNNFSLAPVQLIELSTLFIKFTAIDDIRTS